MYKVDSSIILAWYVPLPWQYLHLFFSCCLTLLASINIKAEMTPTAPPEKDATIGSTWLKSEIKEIRSATECKSKAEVHQHTICSHQIWNQQLGEIQVNAYLNCSGRCTLRMKSSYEVPPKPTFNSSCHYKHILTSNSGGHLKNKLGGLIAATVSKICL